MATTVWYIVDEHMFAAGNKPQLLIQSELHTERAK